VKGAAVISIQRVGPAPLSPNAAPHMVHMRDGVRLATDVYLPGRENLATAAPRDTVLIRLPYDKSGDYSYIPLVAEYFMAHGYAVVAQDVRGKFRSEGQALLFVNEERDGFDTIDWIVRQPWSNGSVAMWGASYYGFTQWAAVASGHPALKAISPSVTGTELGEPVRIEPGRRTRRVEWMVTLQYPLNFFHSNDNYFWEFDEVGRPFSAHVESALSQIGARSASYDQWYPHPVHLPRFSRGASPFQSPAVPTLHTIGWWDNCAWLSWQDVERIQQVPAWDANHFLRIESVDHEDYVLDEAEDMRVEARSEAQVRAKLPSILDPTIAFFEVFVRGAGSWRDIPRVGWNLARTEGMRASPSWPPPGCEPRVLFAHSDGTLGTEAPEGTETLRWVHDPFDLVPSSVPNAFAFLLTSPDETPISARNDVLSFTAEAVAEELDLVGPVSVELCVGSSGPVMDVFVQVLDVFPNGSSFRIARGNLQIDNPGAASDVCVDVGQVGYRLQRGHRLRVTIASSNYPEYVPQPGNGQDPWGASDREANTQSLTITPERPFILHFSQLTGVES
jgi:uncharacterized protein